MEKASKRLQDGKTMMIVCSRRCHNMTTAYKAFPERSNICGICCRRLDNFHCSCLLGSWLIRTWTPQPTLVVDTTMTQATQLFPMLEQEMQSVLHMTEELVSSDCTSKRSDIF